MKIKRILKHKNKLFILMLTLISALSLFLNIGKTYAYEPTDDGNIKSSNLIDNEKIEYGSAETSIADGIVKLNIGTYTFSYSGITLNSGAWQIFLNGSLYRTLNLTTKTTTFSISSDNTTFRFYANRQMYNAKFMLNKGSTALDYEPYNMTWIKESLVAQQSNIAMALIDTQVKTFLSNETPTKTLSQLRSETPYLTSNYVASNISYYSLQKNNPTIYDLIFNNSSSSIQGYRYLLNFYDFAVPLNVDNLIFNRGDTTGRLYITLYFVNGDSTQLVLDEGSDANRKSVSWVNSNALQIEAISTTSHIGYNAVSTWTMSNSSVIYQDGYYNGYYEGYGEGYDNGLQVNQSDSYSYGYNMGYNEGINGNVETNGFRVLFNSILSYPVNMIKGVFNFNFMGINVASLILFLISIGIVIFVIKKFK